MVLAMTLEICGTQRRTKTEGIVVGCEGIGKRLWAVTVLFLERPEGLRKIEDTGIGERFTVSE